MWMNRYGTVRLLHFYRGFRLDVEANRDLAFAQSSAVLQCSSARSCRHGACFSFADVCRAPLAKSQRSCLCFAKPAKQARAKTPGKRQSPRTLKSSKAPKDSEGAGLGVAKWKFFSAAEFKEVPAWDVPWGWQTIVFGMFAWGFTFILTGLLSLPISVAVLDIENLKSLTAMQQSEIQLFDQACQKQRDVIPEALLQTLLTFIISTIVGVGLIRYIASRNKDEVPDDFLWVSIAEPFSFPSGWAAWSIVGLMVAPVAIIVSSTVFSLLPQEMSNGRGTVDAVAGLVETVDPKIFVNLLIVTGVLAPILEETIFRGFLLTSLTRYMSLPAAAAVSAVVFAACHLSLRDFPQLVALGFIMGLAYGRSRNLLTSIAIHAAWNSTVVAMLFVLVNSGLSLTEILGE